MAKKKTYTILREKLNNWPIAIYTSGGREYPSPQGMPSSVKVHGKIFQVIYHSNIYAEPKESQRLRGLIEYNHRLIFIDPKQSLPALRETLYHEMAHAYLLDWQYRGGLKKITPAQEEDLCDFFAEAHADALG